MLFRLQKHYACLLRQTTQGNVYSIDTTTSAEILIRNIFLAIEVKSDFQIHKWINCQIPVKLNWIFRKLNFGNQR